MSKFSGFVGDEKPLLLLLLLTTAAAAPVPELDDFLMLGDVGVKLHDDETPLLLLMLLMLLLLLVIRSETNVL